MMPSKTEDATSSDYIIAALKVIPKLGDKKISLLIERYGSLKNIGSAKLDELSSLLGSALGQSVWEFFQR